MIFSQQTYSTEMDSSVSIPQDAGNQVRETQKFKKFSRGGPPDTPTNSPHLFMPPTHNFLKKGPGSTCGFRGNLRLMQR